LIRWDADAASHDSYVLLCTQDAQLVSERPHDFPPSILVRLKKRQEETATRIAESVGAAADRVTLRVHTAMFMPSSPPYFFLKIRNESSESIHLKDVWFATNPIVAVENPQRPLPTVVAPGDLFETWILTELVPLNSRIYFLARAEIEDGVVIESLPNTQVPPAGMIGGGGQPLSVLTDAVAAANHRDGELIPKEWDVFISHATPDKDAVVRPLANALRERGLRVWYDEFELRWGSSLRRSIDEGVAKSRFGVVVLSVAFFKNRPWTAYELDGLVTRNNFDGQIILPLWHGVTHRDVMKFSPSLADKLARSTDSDTIDGIAADISDLVRAAVNATP
jgi:TIR domain